MEWIKSIREARHADFIGHGKIYHSLLLQLFCSLLGWEKKKKKNERKSTRQNFSLSLTTDTGIINTSIGTDGAVKQYQNNEDN